LIADEPTFALDVTIQAQILDMLKDMVSKESLSTMIITRDLGIVANYCDRVCVLYAGQIVEIAEVYEIFANPRHPYTISLIECIQDREKGMQSPLLGFMVDLKHLPAGCYLYDVCPYRKTICRDRLPGLNEINPGHYVRCHKNSEIGES
jgi:oligopeptide/dipeptide ABC transporter ATP-binding protein